MGVTLTIVESGAGTASQAQELAPRIPCMASSQSGLWRRPPAMLVTSATLSGLTRGLGEPLPATWGLGTSSENGRAGWRKAGRKAARSRASKSSRAGLALQWPELFP